MIGKAGRGRSKSRRMPARPDLKGRRTSHTPRLVGRRFHARNASPPQRCDLLEPDAYLSVAMKLEKPKSRITPVAPSR